MARPLRIQYPGATYHVTCRGNERSDIFRDDEDRRAFLRIMSQSLHIYSVKLHAYVLMNNHFHLLAETPLGNLGEFMRHFNITYTVHFNRRHKRAGNLYRGRYKSILVEKEAYLSAFSRYIHLNPIKVRKLAKKTAQEKMASLIQHSWSSLPGYLDHRKRETMVDYTLVLADYGGNTANGRRAYRKQIIADITTNLAVKEQVIGQSIVGSEGFIQWVHDAFLKETEQREQPSAVEIKRCARQEAILDAIRIETGKDLETLKTEKGDARRIAMDLLYRFGELKGPDIGAIFSVTYSVVSQERKRLREKVPRDRQFTDILRRIESRLSPTEI